MDFQHRQVDIDGSSVHVVQAGDPVAPPVLFLHGWPECWSAWRPVMERAAQTAHVVAIDLPGVGESAGDPTDGTTRAIARLVHRLVGTLGLADLTLVGHDMGGMVAYTYLRAYDDLARAVVMDVAIPGVDPWEQVLRNPYIWHFSFHSIPDLPETMVRGRQRAYFDFFFQVLSADADRITDAARADYVRAYGSDTALSAGFSWYRGFPRDARDNIALAEQPTDTPLLYLRGAAEPGDMQLYLDGFAAAGVRDLRSAVVADAGHFSAEEQPDRVWQLIEAFRTG